MLSGLTTMKLPESLRNLVKGYVWSQVTIGASTARIYRLERSHHPTIYLKLDRNNPKRELLAEQQVFTRLSGKLPVPEVVLFSEDDASDYLVMSETTILNKMAFCVTPNSAHGRTIRLVGGGA